MIKLHKLKTALFNIVMSLLLPLVIYVTFVVITDGRFGGATALRTIARQSIITLLIAMAMSFDMKSGAMDFSSGSVVYASAIIGGSLGMRFGVPGIMIGCFLVAFALCTLSGIMFTLLRIPALVLSVGMLMVFEALPRLLFKNGVAIGLGQAAWGQPPYCFIAFGIIFALYFILINYSEFGHNIQAIGANQAVARSAGVNVDKVKFHSYLFKGVFLGIAAIMYLFTNIKVSTPDTLSSVALIFDSMMGVFIAFFIGRFCGFACGMVVGVFSMKMLTTAMVACGMSTTVRSIVNGFFLLILLCISSNQGRVVEWRKRRKIGRKAAAGDSF